MSVADDREKLIELLQKELGLAPYESKAYVALLETGPLSPQGINQKSGIPRPRTYDVLNSLVGKGLLVEQPGRPTIYAVVDPRVSIAKMMMEIERVTLRQLEERRKTSEKLSSYLSGQYTKTRKMTMEGEMVWVSRRDSALIARYSEAIRNVQKEILIADASTSPPEKEILESIKHALKKNKSVRVIRSIEGWTREQLEEYEGLMKLGEQVKNLEYKGLTFGIFDNKDTVFWFPPHPSNIAVWISLPSLAAILHEHFEMLWKKGLPALPLLKKLMESKI